MKTGKKTLLCSSPSGVNVYVVEPIAPALVLIVLGVHVPSMPPIVVGKEPAVSLTQYGPKEGSVIMVGVVTLIEVVATSEHPPTL